MQPLAIVLLLITFALGNAVADATTTTASADTATIQGSLHLMDELPVISAKVALNNGEQVTYSKLDGSFEFFNVPPGVHLIDVYSHQYQFGQVKVQLLPEEMDRPNCIEYPFPGAEKSKIPYPLQLKAHAKYEYFAPKPSFSLAIIFKNPMMLMMLGSIGLMFLMPKMMENLEPEERERMQKQMAAQQDPSKLLSNLWQDITGNGESDPPPTASKAGKK